MCKLSEQEIDGIQGLLAGRNDNGCIHNITLGQILGS